MNDLKQVVSKTIGELYISALKRMPDDVKSALRQAEEREESKLGRRILNVINENIDVAEKNDLFVCQDTGLPICQVRVGKGFPLSLDRIRESIIKGVKDITKSYPVRSNTLDTVTRKRTFTNTGEGMPVISFEESEFENTLGIKFVPKGSGSENMSFLKMFKPADGTRAVKRFVLECVAESGANPCPPTVVGVGIGGTSDLCMKLAKKAATRNIAERNPEQSIAELEKDLLEKINSLGVGPMGLGGNTTALAVNIEKADTHISLNPVAINMQCWAARRAEAVIESDGKVTIK